MDSSLKCYTIHNFFGISMNFINQNKTLFEKIMNNKENYKNLIGQQK